MTAKATPSARRDRAALRRDFERRVDNQRVIYIPKRGSNKLLIVFSFLGFAGYHRLRVLGNDQRMNLLFLRDTANDFYCCNGRDAVYRKILKRFTTRFEPQNMTTYGVSMGGNGAIFHGLEIGANAIAINPIVDWRSSIDLTDYDFLRERLREIGRSRFVNLRDLLQRRPLSSVVFCQFNRDKMGVANAKILSAAKLEYGSLVYEISNVPVHTAPDEVLSTKGIYHRVALTAQLRKIRVPLHVYDRVGDDITVAKQRI